MGKLDRIELEHSVRRRRVSACGRVAIAAVHKSCADAGSSREAVSGGGASGDFSVRVPELSSDSRDHMAWRGNAGRTIPLAHFISHGRLDTAATINAQLAKGKTCCSHREFMNYAGRFG